MRPSLLAIPLVLAACASPRAVGGNKFQEPAYDSASYGVAYPNRQLTPGDAASSDPAEVCAPGYAKKARAKLSREDRAGVFAEYGVDPKSQGFQVDHLIPLALGGSNAPANLWPIPRDGVEAGVREKGIATEWAKNEVCRGRENLYRLQHDFAEDWYSVYLKASAARKK